MEGSEGSVEGVEGGIGDGFIEYGGEGGMIDIRVLITDAQTNGY